uniref:procollagen-proline 4-dioxygenase n=1 Tax=Clastoptera arizonana TaxID=38151 RepID=A0A1B6CXX7_9HEMI
MELWLNVCFVLVVVTSFGNGELYTALVDMEELLGTEATLIRTLENYIKEQEYRVHLLKKRLADYHHEHEVASQDISNYLANPINAYLLLKRLTSDWKQTVTLLNDDLAQEVGRNMSMYREVLKFPTEEDLTGAAVALMRLQDTYKLETTSIARGELNGIQYSTQLSAGDCFELGRLSYNQQDFYHTVLWMTEALDRQEKERNNTQIERWEILEYLAYSTYMQGNVKSALQMTDELLTLVPTHQRALSNKVYYLDAIEKNVAPLNFNGKPLYKATDELPEREVYEMLCRNAISPHEHIKAQLKCRYVHHNNPFLLIAPLKEEEAYLNPRILLYRQVIYDSEMDVFKKMAHPRLKRATVQNYKTGNLEVAHYRISKSAWLKEEEHPAIARISRRVEDITGLSTSTAEELQVVNYGIGGHYEPHFDFARKEETNAFKNLGTGNRIATVLFYMSEVQQGGATVFPALRLSLWPEKGTAAFWFNLHSNGEGDYLTRHAACPVLAGSKWVSNKWLHEQGQEFLRPCDKDDVPIQS